jgi:hypothetical protein
MKKIKITIERYARPGVVAKIARILRRLRRR